MQDINQHKVTNFLRDQSSLSYPKLCQRASIHPLQIYQRLFPFNKQASFVKREIQLIKFNAGLRDKNRHLFEQIYPPAPYKQMRFSNFTVHVKFRSGVIDRLWWKESSIPSISSKQYHYRLPLTVDFCSFTERINSPKRFLALGNERNSINNRQLAQCYCIGYMMQYQTVSDSRSGSSRCNSTKCTTSSV